MLHNFVFRNEQLIPMQEVRLSPGQAGLLNGWGVFTTIRIYHGRPFAFERHWKRLSSDANRLRIPVGRQPETILEHLSRLIDANHVQEGCGRIYFVYNRVGAWISDETMPEVDLIMYTADLPKRIGPVRLAIQSYGRYAASPLAGVKVTSWLQNVWMLDQALRRSFDEVVLLNERNEVSECTAANIFCVRKREVVTPPLSSGCLPGVTREVLLEMGEQTGLSIEEAPLETEDLYGADEVFITSTTREVQPVSQIEDRKIEQVAGPVTQLLAGTFSQYVAHSFQKRNTPTAI
ncbi:MAG: class IV aminotransferase [Acidobacteria bacterium]|nr:MAG: class IV aminotransferase [Acidobacteriota bacterium]